MKCKHTLYSYSTVRKCSETSHNKRLQGTRGMWPTSPHEENLLLELNKESVFPCARTFYSDKFYPVNFSQWKFTLKLVLVKDLKQEGERCLYFSPPHRQQKLLPPHQPPDYNWHSTQEEHVLCASNNNEQFHVPMSTVVWFISVIVHYQLHQSCGKIHFGAVLCSHHFISVRNHQSLTNSISVSPAVFLRWWSAAES
jgi:hypothetical protein